MSENPYNKICKYNACGKSFIAKRLNQEYDTDECKKKANNYMAAAMRKIFKETHAKLQINWRVVDAFYEAGHHEVSEEQLLGNGYQFDCMTSVCVAANGGQGPVDI